jgi:hypothetical protein
MKRKTFAGLYILLSVSLVASLMLHSGDIHAQTQQKVLQQRKALMVLKPNVTSVTPQKAVITQGGDAVVVEAKGTNLNIINSAQVLRAGTAVAEIEATLDKSLLPTSLKISLKALAAAPVGSDYQLAVFDAGNNKLLDVPTTALAIEVVAPVQNAVLGQKNPVPVTPQQAEKSTTPQEKRMPLLRQEPGFGTGKATAKVEDFLKSVQTARSLAELKAASTRANISQGEIDQVKKAIESSPVLKQKIEQFRKEAEAAAQPAFEQFKRKIAAKVETAKSELIAKQAAIERPRAGYKAQQYGVDCPYDVPVISSIKSTEEGEPIQPGIQFGIFGKGLGTGPGAVDLLIQGRTFPVQIQKWNNCVVWATLNRDDVSGVHADLGAIISLRTNTGRETRQTTRFKPTLVFVSSADDRDLGLYDQCHSTLCFGSSCDTTFWKMFALKNDWCIVSVVFDYSVNESGGPGSGHAELTKSPPLNTPNCSAETHVHAGASGCAAVYFSVHILIEGPKGVPYK